jgi:LPXTG-motif cell wall-anchored protein
VGVTADLEFTKLNDNDKPNDTGVLTIVLALIALTILALAIVIYRKKQKKH